MSFTDRPMPTRRLDDYFKDLDAQARLPLVPPPPSEEDEDHPGLVSAMAIFLLGIILGGWVMAFLVCAL